jgi:TIR domain
MSGGIFISYRRDDARHAAGRLVERLSPTFAHDQLFFDIENIEPGLDFRNVLSQKVQACDVMLAVIGPAWLTTTDEKGGRRIDNPKDFVRIEIEAALARDIRIVPVLVDGARMLGEEDLPKSLRALSDRQAVRLTHERFGPDTEDLVRSLSKVISARERTPTRAGEMGSREWRVSLVSRSQRGFVMRIEAGTEVHTLELEFKWHRLRDRFILDGKEEWFMVLSNKIKKQFRIGNYSDVFELRVTLPMSTVLLAMPGIKDVELLRNGATIFREQWG